jgi:oxysterol-binding protein-related protein 8
MYVYIPQLPPTFNMPKSQLQWYGECVYSTATGVDLLNNINNGKTALDRLISVVAWSISTTRPQKFGFAPYNPILGETHHVSKGNLNVLLEQVCFLFPLFVFQVGPQIFLSPGLLT